MDTCQQCERPADVLIPCRLTNMTTINHHIMVSGRGGREQSYSLYLCPDCLVNLTSAPGGDHVKVEPDMLAMTIEEH